MRSIQTKINDVSLNVDYDCAERQLQELLALFDETAGCEIVALHVDQAINALKEINQRQSDQSEPTR